MFSRVVGVTGIEPVIPSMSTKCSPAELYAHFHMRKSLGQTPAAISLLAYSLKDRFDQGHRRHLDGISA